MKSRLLRYVAVVNRAIWRYAGPVGVILVAIGLIRGTAHFPRAALYALAASFGTLFGWIRKEGLARFAGVLANTLFLGVSAYGLIATPNRESTLSLVTLACISLVLFGLPIIPLVDRESPPRGVAS